MLKGGFRLWEFSYDLGSRGSGACVRNADDKRKK